MNWLLDLPPFGAQLPAVERSFGKDGWGHFLEQGLGKTAVTFNEWKLYSKEGQVDALVVVAPKSLLLNWKNEAEKFSVFDPIVIWDANRQDKCLAALDRLIFDRDKPFIFVINYESTIEKGGGKALHKVIDKRRVMIVADESISLKNPNSKRSKELRDVSKRCVIRRILSGAPVTQGVHDLWAQLRFVGALEGTNYFAFRNRYCVMGGYRGKQVMRPREDTAAELDELLSKWSWRAEKKDWTDIPEKLYTTRTGEMRGAHLEAYNAMRDDFVITLRDSAVTADLVITKLMKLQQISTGFIMDAERKVHEFVPDKDNPKLNMLLDLIEETQNKMIIFAFHRHAVTLLRRNLPFERTAVIEGGIGADEIERQKAKFNQNDKVRFLICQITSSMYGHTLLGTANSPCHTTVFFENVYSFNARTQAEDRNHRHGQRNPVLYVDLITSDMDEIITMALKRKQNVAHKVMEALKLAPKDHMALYTKLSKVSENLLTANSG